MPIAEALYPRYSILFMIDDATCHSVYDEDALCAYKMNKETSGKQIIFCNGWYIDQIDMYHIQPIWYLGTKRDHIPKKIHRILTERVLWPATGLNLRILKAKMSQLSDDCRLKILYSRHTMLDLQREKISQRHLQIWTKM